MIDADLLPRSVLEPTGLGTAPKLLPDTKISMKEAISSYERELIIRALQASGGVQKRAADLLSVKPTTLHEMMKRLNVTVDSIATH